MVGGSGMLAGLCRGLAADGWTVTVVGRDARKLRRAAGGDSRIHPLAVDYELLPAFTAALAAHGPFALVVAWVRSWAPESLFAAADAVAPGGRFFHVIGSERSDASAAVVPELRRRGDLRYRRVQLGANLVDDARRWLTDEEISDGVQAAILADDPETLVGTEP